MSREAVLQVLDEAKITGGRVDLSVSSLRWADLRRVDLRGADLVGADLSHASLHHADLQGADLRYAALHSTDLRGADLRGADLKGADLCRTHWDGLIIDGLHPYRILLIPEPGRWRINICCWAGTPDDLQTLINGDHWPEAKGDEITRRRPLLQAALGVINAHIDAHPDTTKELESHHGK